MQLAISYTGYLPFLSLDYKFLPTAVVHYTGQQRHTCCITTGQQVPGRYLAREKCLLPRLDPYCECQAGFLNLLLSVTLSETHGVSYTESMRDQSNEIHSCWLLTGSSQTHGVSYTESMRDQYNQIHSSCCWLGLMWSEELNKTPSKSGTKQADSSHIHNRGLG